MLFRSVIKDIDVFLPTLSLQKKIGNFLNSIDEKMRKNNEINDNLAYQSLMVA